VYAHRGDRSRAADNTLEAFDLAVEARTDGIELDVRRTTDGVLVVTHDPEVGSLPPVAEMTFADLRDSAPGVPTLSETLAHIPRSVFLNVEIKNAAHEPGFDPDRSIVDATIAIIESTDDLDRVLMSSFDPIAVERTRSVAPGVLTGLLITGAVSIADGVSLALGVDADALHPPMSTLNGNELEGVRTVHASGLAVVVWNANEAREVKRAAKAGVDVIITDDPTMAKLALGGGD
jgi:glycerophosphoryl diester phosphodiesterase